MAPFVSLQRTAVVSAGHNGGEEVPHPVLSAHRLHPLHEWGIEDCIFRLEGPDLSPLLECSRQMNALRS